MSTTDDIEKCLKTARTIISEGISHWNETGLNRRRKQEHETLIDCGLTIRDLHIEGELNDEEHEKRRSEIEVAKLILAAADLDADQSDGTLAAQYPRDVLKRMITVDRFRQYDVYEAEDNELQQRIQSHDSQLYEMIRKEVAPQLQSLNEGLTGDRSDLSKFQMRGLKAIYGQRLEMLRKAVGLYISHHGLPNVAEEMEEAILEASEAAKDRKSIVAELEASIEESMDDLSRSLHQSLRDEHRQLETELYRLDRDGGSDVDDRQMSELLDRVENLLEEQAEQKAAISEQIDLWNSKLTELERHIEGLERRRSADDIEAEVAQLVDDELEQLREERERIARQLTALEAERAELTTAREGLEAKRTPLERGELPDRDVETVDPVLASEARIAEFDYSSRFEQAVHDVSEIVLPDGDSFSADTGYWRDHHRRHDDRGRMRSLLKTHGEDGTDIEARLGQYPLNRHSRFVVERSGRLPLTGSRELTIELRMKGHLETFARYGADDRPASRNDLLEVINDVVRGAEQDDVPAIVVIASPTGWTDAVERAVRRGEGNGISFSRQVDIVLVDLNGRQVIYDESQSLVSANKQLFEFDSLSESAQDCREAVETDLLGTDPRYVRLQNVVEDMGFSEQVVSMAFDRLAEDGVGLVRQTSQGLVLDLRDESVTRN